MSEDANLCSVDAFCSQAQIVVDWALPSAYPDTPFRSSVWF
jgi:hypothetical protein